jgi:hypothetical protein
MIKRELSLAIDYELNTALRSSPLRLQQLHLYYSVPPIDEHAVPVVVTASAVLTRLENILTYNTLLSLVRCDQKWQYNAAHLPHAADYTSRYENVLHYRWSAVWGKGKEEK